MTVTMHSTDNGRKRPNLSEQINRLDQTLDGLADGLNDAVADAVKDAVGHAVREAVQAALKEVLGNPEVMAKLHTPVATFAEPAPRPTLRDRLNQACAGVRSCISALRSTCAAGVQTVRTKISNGWTRTLECVKALWSYNQYLSPFKYQILLGVGIGVVTGIGVANAEPWVGATMSGIGSCVTTLAVQAGLWLRRVLNGNETA